MTLAWVQRAILSLFFLNSHGIKLNIRNGRMNCMISKNSWSCRPNVCAGNIYIDHNNTLFSKKM